MKCSTKNHNTREWVVGFLSAVYDISSPLRRSVSHFRALLLLRLLRRPIIDSIECRDL